MDWPKASGKPQGSTLGLASLSVPRQVSSAKKIPNFSAIRQSESSTEISGNSPSLMGVRKVGALLNESAQADAAGHGRPAEGIPAIDGGEDVKVGGMFIGIDV